MKNGNFNKLENRGRNTKVMVNWDKKLVLSTQVNSDSPQYLELIKLGYEEVGEFKPAKDAFYWHDRYFLMGHKLLA